MWIHIHQPRGIHKPWEQWYWRWLGLAMFPFTTWKKYWKPIWGLKNSKGGRSDLDVSTINIFYIGLISHLFSKKIWGGKPLDWKRMKPLQRDVNRLEKKSDLQNQEHQCLEGPRRISIEEGNVKNGWSMIT